MRRALVLLALASLFSGSAPALAAEGGDAVLTSRITSVGLFKNGLALVRREVSLPGNGTWQLRELPEAVHGTLWIESDAELVARVTRRTVQEPLDASLDLQHDLAGRQVRLRLRGEDRVISGRVLPMSDERQWSRSYEQPPYWHWAVWSPAHGHAPSRPPSRFLLLESEGRTLYLDSSSIVSVELEQTDVRVERQRPVLLLEASGLRRAATASISYLTKGLAWAPSYRVDLSHPQRLSIEQKAVLKNELEDFRDAEVHLISGFPSVEFSHVLSPLSPATSWAGFFQQLGQRLGAASSARAVVTQQVVTNVAPSASTLDSSAVPTGEGPDIHYQPVGRHSMLAGDSLLLPVARASAGYQRVVEWIVPDTRDEMGRRIEDWRRQQDPEAYEDAVWDAVRFHNPFAFPMTTAPATIVEGRRFSGQRLSSWVDPGEGTTLRITKALSIRTTSSEVERDGEREYLIVGGRRFRKPTVEGELRLANHRKEAVTLVVRRRFSGELVEASGTPVKTLREEGAYSVNPRQELSWTLELGPGEETTLTYRYSVLVYH